MEKSAVLFVGIGSSLRFRSLMMLVDGYTGILSRRLPALQSKHFHPTAGGLLDSSIKATWLIRAGNYEVFSVQIMSVQRDR